MGNLSPGFLVPFSSGYVMRKALTIRHIDRYDGHYLVRPGLPGASPRSLPICDLVDAEISPDEVDAVLEKSLAREVARTAIFD